MLRCMRVRLHTARTPVLILTAHGATDDCIKELSLGADDYLPKPFELVELEARIKALLRHSSKSLAGDAHRATGRACALPSVCRKSPTEWSAAGRRPTRSIKRA